MDKAKDSVKKFLGNTGHHDTTVHESTAPAVMKEDVVRTQNENVTPVVNKEVHQDHHHTTVQPITHSERLPEQHHVNTVPVERREFEHDDQDNVERRLAAEKAQFTDEKRHVEGENTTTNIPVVTGEHKHHHVHETIQPVIHKQTIEPHVVHTTVPVQEVHHDVTQHHEGSTLPTMTMDEFKKQGGALEGSGERVQRFDGDPKLVDNLGSSRNLETVEGTHVAREAVDGSGTARNGDGHKFGIMDGGKR